MLIYDEYDVKRRATMYGWYAGCPPRGKRVSVWAHYPLRIWFERFSLTSRSIAYMKQTIDEAEADWETFKKGVEDDGRSLSGLLNLEDSLEAAADRIEDIKNIADGAYKRDRWPEHSCVHHRQQRGHK